MKAKDMIVGQWYEGYGMQVVCMGLMSEGKFMKVAIDGDKDMQSLEGWPLDKDVTIFLCIVAYGVIGFFVALLFDRYSRDIHKAGLNADCLTTINLFWPLCLPDLLYRMIRGKWYGEPR